MQDDNNNIDPVFGPSLVGAEGARPRNPVPARPLPRVTASMLVNVTFRVSLTDPAAAQPDADITAFARSSMQSAVLREVTAAPGAYLDGGVAVTAQLTRD